MQPPIDSSTQDPDLDALYAELGPVEPGPNLDRRVLDYARSARRRPWYHAPQVVWPMSAAAAVLIAVGLIVNLTPMLPLGHPEIDLRDTLPTVSEYEPLPPPAPVGGEPEVDGGVQNGSLAFDSRTSDEATQQRLAIELMAQLANGTDLSQGDLLETYYAARRRWPDLELPQDLQQAIDEALALRTRLDPEPPAVDND